jgi:hypothetical protein
MLSSKQLRELVTFFVLLAPGYGVGRFEKSGYYDPESVGFSLVGLFARQGRHAIAFKAVTGAGMGKQEKSRLISFLR